MASWSHWVQSLKVVIIDGSLGLCVSVYTCEMVGMGMYACILCMHACMQRKYAIGSGPWVCVIVGVYCIYAFYACMHACMHVLYACISCVHGLYVWNVWVYTYTQTEKTWHGCCALKVMQCTIMRNHRSGVSKDILHVYSWILRFRISHKKHVSSTQCYYTCIFIIRKVWMFMKKGLKENNVSSLYVVCPWK